MKNFYLTKQSDLDLLSLVSHALSSVIRVKIITQLQRKPMTITELSELNSIPNSTIIFHLKVLEKANLISINFTPNKKGLTQVIFSNFKGINIRLNDLVSTPNDHQVYNQSCAIGDYIEAKFYDGFSLVNDYGFMKFDKSQAFDSFRKDAINLATPGGIISYAFSNFIPKKHTVNYIKFSLEICSEVPFYRNDWPSDITFFINDKEILLYKSSGDYGGTKGILNPSWWPLNNTQYGDLVSILINTDGTFLNNKLVDNKITIDSLDLKKQDKIKLSFGNKIDCKHMGGFNIFGKKFGNHEQDILMEIGYKI